MSTVLLVDATTVDAAPETVFDLFGQGSDRSGWLFGADCDAVEPGAVVRFRLPLDAHFDGERELEANGRILEVDRPRRLVIAHETPWRGRLICTLVPDGRGTRLRLVCEVDDTALEWLMRRQGHEVAGEVDTSATPIGLLISQSGSASVFSAGGENLARMAVDEINADGGLLGRRARLVVADDASQPARGVRAMRRLVETSGCSVVIAGVTSETFRAIQPVAEKAGVLLIYPLLNEGGRTNTRVFRLGERPDGQLRFSIPWLMRMTGGRRWYLAGNNYCWPKATNRCAKRVIAEQGGAVVAEHYAMLGTRSFDPLLDAIERSGAELVISTFVGADEVAFERQFHAAGLRDRFQTLALALDENTREHVGPVGAGGLWAVFGYFQGLATAANRGFLDRYHRQFGATPPPVSSITESVYEAVHLYAAAARQARSLHPLDIGRAMSGRSFDGPRGEVRIGHPGEMHQHLFLAQAALDGFDIVDAIG